jgi:hypothetical protein
MPTNTPKYRPVIEAPAEFQAKMQRLFAQPPVSFEQALAQTQAVLRTRSANTRNNEK